MTEQTRSGTDDEVRIILADFCEIARQCGTAAARRTATASLVASAAYLEDQFGPVKARQILAATIAEIGPGKTGPH